MELRPQQIIHKVSLAVLRSHGLVLENEIYGAGQQNLSLKQWD